MSKIFQFIKKWGLPSLLLLLFCAFFYLHLYDYLSLHTVKLYELDAVVWTQTHYTAAVCLYLLVYVALIACAIPCATLLTLIGGFLFGTIALLYAIVGTTMGGTILFLAVRTAIGKHIAMKSTGWIKSMEHGFQRNAFNYLLMLRLVPVLPCWISNVSAGALNVPIKTFVVATMIGIFPATLIYVLAGRSLDKLLMEQTPSVNTLLSPSIFFPLLGLALLSVFPIVYKSVKKRIVHSKQH